MRLIRRCAVVAALLTLMGPRAAQEPPAAAVLAAESLSAAAADDSNAWGASRVEAFFDGLLYALLEDHHVAGATLAVVRNGEVLLAKGYGYDDEEERRAVDPELSLFRIGSISKTFAWTAIMQLVEEGRVDLGADVNIYLRDFQIPATYPQPITLEHLLTHTPGFEDQVLGLFGRDASTLAPLGQILARELPARVRPPGIVSSYSNHGTGIAGYIVEQVSGKTWDDYVEQRILQPLGMRHTTFRQPIPAEVPGRMSKGYRWVERFIEEPFEFVPLSPVGAASTSAADMARYMIAHLQLGQLGDVRVLQETTARRMQAELFRHAPTMNPMAHGFYEMSRNGQRVIGHGGDTLWFHSEMALVPDAGAGIFVSTNSAGGGAAAASVFEAFMDEFFPVDAAARIAAADDFASSADRYLGHYRPDRYSHTTIAKLAAISTVEVTLNEHGDLQTSATGATRWIEVAPLSFRDRDGPTHLAFREDAQGRVTHMFLERVPVVAFERIGVAGNPRLHAALAGFAILLQLAVMVLWPLAAMVRAKHSYTIAEPFRLRRVERLTAWMAATLLVAFALLLGIGLANPNEIVFAIPTALNIALALPLLAAPLALAALWFALRLWRQRCASIGVRCVYTLLALSFVTFYWQLWYWNLLGYRT